MVVFSDSVSVRSDVCTCTYVIPWHRVYHFFRLSSIRDVIINDSNNNTHLYSLTLSAFAYFMKTQHVLPFFLLSPLFHLDALSRTGLEFNSARTFQLTGRTGGLESARHHHSRRRISGA